MEIAVVRLTRTASYFFPHHIQTLRNFISPTRASYLRSLHSLKLIKCSKSTSVVILFWLIILRLLLIKTRILNKFFFCQLINKSTWSVILARKLTPMALFTLQMYSAVYQAGSPSLVLLQNTKSPWVRSAGDSHTPNVWMLRCWAAFCGGKQEEAAWLSG